MLTLANPAKFMGLSARLLPWLLGLTVVAFAAGLPLALVFSPPDYQQSEAVRILYIHVPAAILAPLVYAGMAAAAFSHLVWRAPLADIAAEALAPMGAVLTAIALATSALLTGSLGAFQATLVILLARPMVAFLFVLSSFEQGAERPPSA